MLALDVDSEAEVDRYLSLVGQEVGAIKIGPRLGFKYGSQIINKVQKVAPVFVDNKYFDITSTVLSSVQTSFESGATFVTVHALNGLETLTELAQLEEKLNKTRPFKILAVTVLTSWSEKNIPSNFKSQSIDEHVLSLAQIVEQAGLSGVVCSGHELSLLPKSLFKVVPGIRTVEEITSSQKQDQKRVISPSQAIHLGANGLVIGRSILNSRDPQKTVQQILESIQHET